MNKQKENEIRSFLGKETYKYPLSIDEFLRACEQDIHGIQACGVNSFISGRKAFLRERNSGVTYGNGLTILLSRWLDYCKKPKHFKEVFFCAINTSGYGLEPETIVWEWIKTLYSKKQFIDLFKVINKNPQRQSISIETRAYAMQRFINICIYQ